MTCAHRLNPCKGCAHSDQNRNRPSKNAYCLECINFPELLTLAKKYRIESVFRDNYVPLKVGINEPQIMEGSEKRG